MAHTITIISISTGDPELLNYKTIRAMKECRQLILRTSVSPIVSWLEQEHISYSSLDDLYNEAEDFDQLLSMISDRLWSFAEKLPVVYAVTDLLTDASIRHLYQSKPADGTITVIPGIGISSAYSSSVLSILSRSDLRTVSATDFLSADYDPNTSLLITELDNAVLAGEIKILLSSVLPDECDLYYLHGKASPTRIPLYELDRRSDIDHLSAVMIPGKNYTDRNSFVFNDLLHIMERLRSSEGCPWDREQTHQSLRPYIVEEAWECIACIDEQNMEHLCEELGDLLFQIVFHSSVAKSYDEFAINDVINNICKKMIRRHPHVFANVKSDSKELLSSWESIKQDETGHKTLISSLDDVSSGLPALKYASKIFKKLSAAGITRQSFSPVLREMAEVLSAIQNNTENAGEDYLGRLLLLCSELCFLCGYDSETILHRASDRMKSHISRAESLIIRDGKSLEHLTFDELGVYLKYVEDETE